MDIGHLGEEAAVRYLKRRGWLPLARNWKSSRGGEIDIIVRRRGILAFVEVKTRSDPAELVEPVSLRQRRRIADGAAAYVARHPRLETLSVRFDVVAVDRSWTPARVTHHPDAFDPPPSPRTARSAGRQPS